MNWTDHNVVFVAQAYAITLVVFLGLALRAAWRLTRLRKPPE